MCSTWKTTSIWTSWVGDWAYVLDFMTWTLARAYQNVGLGYMIKYMRDIDVKCECHCLRTSHITREIKVEVYISPTAYMYMQQTIGTNLCELHLLNNLIKQL